jgi:hypothetical protein
LWRSSILGGCAINFAGKPASVNRGDRGEALRSLQFKENNNMEGAILQAVTFQDELRNNPEKYANEKIITMTKEKFVEVIEQARARSGKYFRKEIAESKQLIELIERELELTKKLAALYLNQNRYETPVA